MNITKAKQFIISNSALGEPTLHLKRPFGRTLGLAVLMLAMMVSLGEMAARTDLARQYLPSPGLGTGHDSFEVLVSRLDALVESEGAVDCIFLGNSLVYRGINPEIVQQIYKARTGENIRCFSFGKQGLTGPIYFSPIAELLVKKYQPKLLVVILPPMSLYSGDRRGQNVLMSHPWLQYWRGSFNFDGWLLENSIAFRYWYTLKMNWNYPEMAAKIKWRERVTSKYGYCPTQGVFDMDESLRRLRESPLRQIMAKAGSSPQAGISPQQLAALEDLGQLQPQTQVMLLEAPNSPVIRFAYGDDPEIFRHSAALVRAIAARQGLQYWPAPPRQLFPDEFWKDHIHLNDRGATVFSRWLGERLAEPATQALVKDLGR